MIPTREQIADFARDGYVAMGPVIKQAEVATLRSAFDELEARWARECDVSVERYRSIVSQWTGLWEQHPAFARQIQHPSVEEAARTLLGVERIRLFHDHLISKPPVASSTVPWHQDYPFWPIDAPRALSCWLSLDDASVEGGALQFMPGAHLEGEKPPVDFLRANKDWGARGSDARPVPVEAGWAVFHSCLSWHFSPPNTTSRPRRAFIAIFMDANSRWDPAHSGWHPMNARISVSPGERFNDDAFPLIRRSGSGGAP